MNKSFKALYKMRYLPLLLVPLLVTMMVLPATLMAAEATVNLGTTAPFAVLAHVGITNSGTTTIYGDIGTDTGTITGAGLTINGATHIADAVAIQAQTDLVTAYNDAASRTNTATTGVELGTATLTPGVYSSGGVLQINGTLTLDAQGDPNAVFIFKSTATLTTGTGSNVNLINGARFCRVFWVVPSNAALGVSSHFAGHIFAGTSITVNTGATVDGQLLARTGNVTLLSNTITNGPCLSGTTPSAAVTAATPGSGAAATGSGTLTVYKVDSSGNPIVAASQASVADFDIYANEADIAANSPFQKGSTVIGTNSFSTSLQNGTYYVVEKSAPEGYDVDGVVRSVTISGESVSLTFADTIIEVAAEEVTTTTAPPVTVTSTITGGQLPKTGTPWYNVLLIGIILMLIGAGVWITRKVYERRSKT